MAGYHKFVFDPKTRRFLGRFEEMYQAEAQGGFDSWHQDDLRNLVKRLCLEIISARNYSRILDLGCGKGAFTQVLKKQNNEVVGIDIAESCIRIAAARCPDMKFIQLDVSKDLGRGETARKLGKFDLVIALEILSYVANWKKLIAHSANLGRFFICTLFLPEKPMGYVKSFTALEREFSKHFRTIEHAHFVNRRQVVLFGESRRAKSGKASHARV